MEVDWEYQKNVYITAVSRHMHERSGPGVLSELHQLMTDVDQTPGGTWQHPSDLTRRNYQQRFGNTVPTMTLREWQARNSIPHWRFAAPRVFERSPL